LNGAFEYGNVATRAVVVEMLAGAAGAAGDGVKVFFDEEALSWRRPHLF
jgi:hypothetical protein